MRGEIDDEDALKIAKEVNNKQNNITNNHYQRKVLI